MFVTSRNEAVYHAAGRRFLTKHGAYQAAAEDMIRTLRCLGTCEACEDGKNDDGQPCRDKYPDCKDPRSFNDRRHKRLVSRLVRRMRWADKREALSA